MESTTYIHSKLEYFFNQSESLEVEVGRKLSISFGECFSLMDECSPSQQSLLNLTLKLMSFMLQEQGYFLPHSENIERFLDNDGFKSALFCLQNYLGKLTALPLASITLEDEIIIKNLLNILYMCTMQWKNKIYSEQKQVRDKLYTNITKLLKDLDLDSLIIRMITMTLEFHYLPVKKIVLFYTRILALMFASDNIYNDEDLIALGKQNQISEDYLSNLKKQKTQQALKHSTNPIEAFYARHNVGDCPLAQSIVVGLLRSLLTICNSQNHKKFSMKVQKGSGVDSYRQWQISYQFFLQNQNYASLLNEPSKKILKLYQQFNESSSSESPIYHQFYSHKIYCTASITVFFAFLLISFKKNTFIQFTYLFQLISDANGILVFLKFLTDKFQSLQPLELRVKDITFKNEVMLTVYSVLSILFGACNNYTQKTRSYLFQYNSYLIIKKIPHLFMEVQKNDEQLPSQEEIREQFGNNPLKEPLKQKVKQLTELCYDLLKIQIPFFSKKSKDASTHMKMIVDIYCQLPKEVKPMERTEMQKLYLKTKFRKPKVQKWVRSVEELKGIHNEYNNYYYWANDHLQVCKLKKQQKEEKKEELDLTPENMEAWLEKNVWRYYD